jgi:hypothetical protein
MLAMIWRLLVAAVNDARCLVLNEGATAVQIQAELCCWLAHAAKTAMIFAMDLIFDRSTISK